MRWFAASTSSASLFVPALPERNLKGLLSRPSPGPATAGFTNQITVPLMLKLAVAAALHALGAGPSPLSQTVYVKLTLPVTPGAGSIVNAPVEALATTLPTPAIVAVIVPPTGATPLTVPTVKTGV